MTMAKHPPPVASSFATVSWGQLLRLAWLQRLSLVVAVLVLAGCQSNVPERSQLGRERPARKLAEPKQLNVEPATIKTSVHAALDCSDCHGRQIGDASTARDSVAGDATRCVPCHEAAQKAYDTSIHGSALASGTSGAARCSHCHGAHDIRKVTDPQSPVSKLRIADTCSTCHQNAALAKELGIRNPQAASQYLESIHGRALVDDKLTVAPSCLDCHGKGHAIRPAADPESAVNAAKVPETCGKCHVGPRDLYKVGIHGQRVAQGDSKAPTCISCHSAHSIRRPSSDFVLASDEMCGKCHAGPRSQYLQSYHGRAHDLGSDKVAACFDCHGAHDVRAMADPQSRLAGDNRLQTCRQCHTKASPKFASFMAHGDYRDKERYPLLWWAFMVMTGLILGTFAAWGVHTFLWIGRTVVVYRRNPARFNEIKRKARDESGKKLYQRFRPIDRFCHMLIIVSFMLLVITGMPLKFHNTWWAHAFFRALGGPGVAAALHRFGAILSFAYLFIHVASLVGPVRSRWQTFRDESGKFRPIKLLGFVFGPDSPLPNFSDLKDVRDHMLWFFGKGPQPQFDRFTYWEKFDYFAELWGSAFIGLSGLVMWFPEQMSTFMPGWLVNLAQVIHSQEALLAAGFILTFHFFNSHFRLEKFPLDTVMFSGRITEDEMKHERGRQYARLAAEGRLESLEVKDEWQGWKYILNTFGITALVIGTILAFAIFYGLSKLWIWG
jgi:cytochrome b subunit of formate dehydrogenase